MDEKLELLRSVPLFSDLDERSLEAIGVLAHELLLPAGHVLMREGEPGTTFYVIAEGTLRVERSGATVRSMIAGGFLGEIALLENGPRTATATCVMDCRLLAIEHHEFDRLMQAFPHLHRRIEAAIARRRPAPARRSIRERLGYAPGEEATMDQKLQLLKTVPLFAELDDRAIGVVGELTEDVDVKAGHVLMRQGDRGDAFYVLVDGIAKIERDGKLLKTVGPGAYFGEIALLDHGVRTATVTTETPSKLIVLGHREFEALLDRYDDIRGQIWECVGRRIRTLEPEAVN